MKIYSFNMHPYSGSDSTYTNNGSIYPVVFEGVIYNKNNPYYSTIRAVSNSKLSYPMTISRISSSTKFTIGEIVSGQANSYGFPRLIYVPDNVTVTRATLLEQATISGLYRFNYSSFTNTSEYLSDGCVDVSVEINGVTYCALCFPYYSTGWYAQNRIPWQDNQDVGKHITAYITPVEPRQTPIGYTILSNGANTLKSEYVGSVWNFGSAPQIVPKVFKDWVEANAQVIYDNSYTIKTQNGAEEITKIVEAPTMVKGNLSVVGDRKTLVLTDSNGIDYTINWDSETPEGKSFTGLSFAPNSKIANIPVGIETYFNLEGDISLYESYGVYRPPVTTFDVNLYQNTAEANRVDKTNYISTVGTLSGVLRDESSITDVTITFESVDIPTFNYVYISAFNRYYFVNDITSIKYKLWQMSLSVDPLMTYKDAILSCNGFIDRNENDYNPNVIDKKRVVAQGHTVQVDSVTNELFTATSGTYVLNGLLVSIDTN